MHAVLLDKELPALYVPQSVYATEVGKCVDVYGDPQRVERFIDGIEAWIDLGEPKITDYHVELIDPAASSDTEPHGLY